MSNWKWKFENFERAFLRLKEAMDALESLSILEKEGLLQRFEYSFELAWKVIQAYLQEQGFIIRSPKEAIRHAFQWGLIEDGELWLQALQIRNLTVHTYNETILDESIAFVEKFFPSLEALYRKLKAETEK